MKRYFSVGILGLLFFLGVTSWCFAWDCCVMERNVGAWGNTNTMVSYNFQISLDGIITSDIRFEAYPDADYYVGLGVYAVCANEGETLTIQGGRTYYAIAAEDYNSINVYPTNAGEICSSACPDNDGDGFNQCEDCDDGNATLTTQCKSDKQQGCP